MPLLRIDPGIMIWTWVSFLLVLIILRATTWKKIITGLNARSEKIHNDLLEAQRMKEEAKTTLKAYREQFDGLKEQSKIIVENAKVEANLAKEKILKEAKDKVEQSKLMFIAEMNSTSEEALSKIKTQSVELAESMAQSILKRSVSKEDNDRLLSKFIDDISKE